MKLRHKSIYHLIFREMPGIYMRLLIFTAATGGPARKHITGKPEADVMLHPVNGKGIKLTE